MMFWFRQASQQHKPLGKIGRSVWANALTAAGMILVLLMASIIMESLMVHHALVDSNRARSQDEVRHIVEAMATTIEADVLPLAVIGPDMDLEVQERVKRMIRNARFDNSNGYFILFSLDGTALAHGVDPTLEGTNRHAVKDEDGIPYIQLLIQAAHKGGGFIEYKRTKPDSGRPTSKMGYARILKGNQWWIATGADLSRIDEITQEQLDVQLRQLVWLAMTLFVLLLVLLLTIFRRVKALEYLIMAEQMKMLSRMVDDERGLLAMELHNLVGGVTTLLTSNSELAKAADATTLRQMFDQGVSEVIDHLDRRGQDLIHKIFPLVVQKHGIGALKQLVRKETNGRDILKVDLVMGDSVARSDNGRERALYLIAQGLLQNVLKYANASQVRITLAFQGENVTLTVEDNGKGFDVDVVVKRVLSTQPRYGIPWMLAQVEVYGGHIIFHSSPGLGTNVRVTMPWPQEPDN
ncbi:MAG TPA: cache domain-containing protein [Nitrospira sp.]|nr:cache domain-containing protein [Nitrospira sp.]